MKKTAEATKVYRFKEAARMRKEVDAQAVGEHIERLQALHGGLVTEDQVVADARDNPTAPTHAVFEWDDSAAAEEYRRVQARHLLRSLVVTIITPKREPVDVCAFVSTPRRNTVNASDYRSLVDVMADPYLRGELLKQALNDLLTLRRKYAELSELSQVFAAIDKLRKSA